MTPLLPAAALLPSLEALLPGSRIVAGHAATAVEMRPGYLELPRRNRVRARTVLKT
ncbi:hypothetical protein [Microbacterium sp. TWP3-1-2b2]|uniref:hypothetical protein n=1 Tax=Microbacterium sp. TWP3-1-2b2 TaxID=2804651 RepID=UPI003CEE6313